MRKSAVLLGVVMALLLAGPAAVAASTYTHLRFDVSPSSLPQGGTTTIILSSVDNTDIPPGGSNYICTAGGILTDQHGNVLGTCTLPFVVPSPACDGTTNPFANYVVSQIKVTTPNDPTGHDVYMLGTTAHAGITSSPITVTKANQPLNVPFGPESSPFTVNGVQYEWYRTVLNGAPAGGSIITNPIPGPTSLPGTYTIDVEGVMNCGPSTAPFTQTFFFDAGFQITTPEFGLMALAVGVGALSLIFLKRKVVTPHIA